MMHPQIKQDDKCIATMCEWWGILHVSPATVQTTIVIGNVGHGNKEHETWGHLYWDMGTEGGTWEMEHEDITYLKDPQLG